MSTRFNNNCYPKQSGFGEHYLFPILVGLAACGYLLIDPIVNLFKQGQTTTSIILLIVSIVLSIWLCAQFFADFLNLIILIIFTIVWLIFHPWLIAQFTEENELIIRVVVPCVYFFIHAAMLTIVSLIKNRERTE